MPPARWCPLCQRGELRRHCPPAVRERPCRWEKCPQCRTTFDPVNNTAVDRNGVPLAWPSHWPSGEAQL